MVGAESKPSKVRENKIIENSYCRRNEVMPGQRQSYNRGPATINKVNSKKKKRFHQFALKFGTTLLPCI